MIKPIRKPIVSTVLLLTVIGLIYVMSSFSQSSLGENAPVGLKSGAQFLKNQNFGFGESPQVVNTPDFNPGDEAAASLNDGSLEKGLKDMENESSNADDKAPQEATPNNVPADQVKVEITETPFMPKMANETLKAQLGNAAWKLLHTILARYPEKPNEKEQSTLYNYIQYFGQVYPCGDCARHFQELLKKYPPQVKSRKTAALWGCYIHNQVNERLEKPEYDCTTILEDYDCGCGDDEKEADETLNDQSIVDVNNIKMEEEENAQLGG